MSAPGAFGARPRRGRPADRRRSGGGAASFATQALRPAGSFATDEELAAAIIHLTATHLISSSAAARSPVR